MKTQKRFKRIVALGTGWTSMRMMRFERVLDGRHPCKDDPGVRRKRRITHRPPFFAAKDTAFTGFLVGSRF